MINHRDWKQKGYYKTGAYETASSAINHTDHQITWKKKSFKKQKSIPPKVWARTAVDGRARWHPTQNQEDQSGWTCPDRLQAWNAPGGFLFPFSFCFAAAVNPLCTDLVPRGPVGMYHSTVAKTVTFGESCATQLKRLEDDLVWILRLASQSQAEAVESLVYEVEKYKKEKGR